MNQLSIKNKDGQFVVDSREVAEMVGKEHKNLLRDIDGYKSILATSSNLSSSDFFIKSTYEDLKNEKRPCYLLTKNGCDMVANKMTGEKGVLFTAAYVTKFNEMEEQEKKMLYKPKMTSVGEVASLIKTLKSTMKEQKSQPHEIAEMQEMICKQFNIKLPEKFVKKPMWEQVQIGAQIGQINIFNMPESKK